MLNKITVSAAIEAADYQALLSLKQEKEKKAGVRISLSLMLSEAVKRGVVVMAGETWKD